MRVLHIGNIANNAYNNARIQRQFGIEADVLCPDYYHIMACPEWEDADFSGSVGNDFFPDWWAVALHGFTRPRWFAQGPLDACLRYLIAFRTRRCSRYWWWLLNLDRWLLCRRSDFATRVHAWIRTDTAIQYRWNTFLGMTAYQLGHVASKFAHRQQHELTTKQQTLGRAIKVALALAQVWRSIKSLVKKEVSATLEEFAFRSFRIAHTAHWYRQDGRCDREVAKRVTALAQVYPAFAELVESVSLIQIKDIVIGFWHPYLRRLLEHYDIVQAYATYTVMPLLAGRRDFLAYEHGTIRKIPFERTIEGQLCALTYREARAVFVTNSDNLKAAARLGLRQEQIVYLPHAFDNAKLERFGLDYAYNETRQISVPRFFSPARQHWLDQDPGWAKGNDRVIRALRLTLDRGHLCQLRLVAWGNDVEVSRALIKELGLEAYVEWVPPMRKRELWREYMEACAVLDQFVVPSMGGVTFEAMALKRRVITAIDAALTTQFFGEAPPIFACSSAEEIADAMCSILSDPTDQEGRGALNLAWIRKYHSARRIVELQLGTYQRILEG